MAQTKTEKLFELIRRKQVVRPRDLEHARIPRTYLNRLAERGQLQRIERGLYTAESLPASEHISLLEVSRKVPSGFRPSKRDRGNRHDFTSVFEEWLNCG